MLLLQSMVSCPAGECLPPSVALSISHSPVPRVPRAGFQLCIHKLNALSILKTHKPLEVKDQIKAKYFSSVADMTFKKKSCNHL